MSWDCSKYSSPNCLPCPGSIQTFLGFSPIRFTPNLGSSLEWTLYLESNSRCTIQFLIIQRSGIWTVPEKMHILIQGCFKLNWVPLKYSWTGKGQLKASSWEIYNRLIKADAFCIISNFWLVRSLDFFINTYTFSLANVCVYLYRYNFFSNTSPYAPSLSEHFAFTLPAFQLLASAVRRVAFQMQCIINSWWFAK